MRKFLISAFVVLCAAKMIGATDWPWWVICIPLYPLALVVVICIVAVLAEEL